MSFLPLTFFVAYLVFLVLPPPLQTKDVEHPDSLLAQVYPTMQMPIGVPGYLSFNLGLAVPRICSTASDVCFLCSTSTSVD